ncbi:glycosyltransferase [Brachybacterium sp. Marseille-Q7125]|uniref:glycosyltransferase n=1 Tax=Brachybacterium sp. Marseille-Q7125 TaxID=2932815 RepID=UPI001FF4A51E|nr:glycosyltransferase [Brachybacterium sp. Marseille-Q7125]
MNNGMVGPPLNSSRSTEPHRASGREVLLLTSLFPVRSAPNRGVFIDHRISALAASGEKATVVDLGYSVLGVRRGSARVRPLPLGIDVLRFTPGIPSWQWRHLRRGDVTAAMVARYARQLARQLDRSRYRLIHAHGMFGIPAGAVARELSRILRIPYMVTFHGSDVNVLMPQQPELFTATITESAASIFVSKALQERAESLGHLPTGNLHVIPNGIDPAIFHSKGRPEEIPLHLLYVGNLNPLKGADRLPEIWELIRAEHPAASLTVLGGGPLHTRLQSAMKGTGTMFRGTVEPPAVAEAMRSAFLVLLPSRSEGWPTVILESYACGTPVIAADVGGSREAVGMFARTVSEGPSFEQRFARACLDMVASPPSPTDLARHAQQFTWAALHRAEADVYARITED